MKPTKPEMAPGKQDGYKRKIYWWCFQVATVWTLISLLIWRCLIPRHPDFTVADLRVFVSDNENSTARYETSDLWNASVLLGIEIFNPNKGMSIQYSDIHITIRHSGAIVAESFAPGFYQTYHKNNNATRVFLVRADLRWLSHKTSLVIGLDTTARYGILKWKTKYHKMHYEAYVHNVTIGLNGTGECYSLQQQKITFLKY
ncbi:hypothetical protein DM860_003000 [Cuscuta australis]|uniref:Late embryogenesis abundant protein LEA-2 subgroup domain-containing protein n=1 Tax=Cuscuta australis TaxID=267555 RepID=A0A328D145_9ASTE|nr:hypothetical protein DM860_003000 [Cuscuta australis]